MYNVFAGYTVKPLSKGHILGPAWFVLYREVSSFSEVKITLKV